MALLLGEPGPLEKTKVDFLPCTPPPMQKKNGKPSKMSKDSKAKAS